MNELKLDKYRILYKVCATEKEAGTHLAKVIKKAKNPYILRSDASGSWLVILCDAENRNMADKAYSYFRQQNLEVAIQKVV